MTIFGLMLPRMILLGHMLPIMLLLGHMLPRMHKLTYKKYVPLPINHILLIYHTLTTTFCFVTILGHMLPIMLLLGHMLSEWYCRSSLTRNMCLFPSIIFFWSITPWLQLFVSWQYSATCCPLCYCSATCCQNDIAEAHLLEICAFAHQSYSSDLSHLDYNFLFRDNTRPHVAHYVTARPHVVRMILQKLTY